MTWGATVDTVWDELPRAPLKRVYDGVAEGDLPAGRADLLLDPQDAADLLALNALLEEDVEAHRLADGSVVLPYSLRTRQLAAALVREHGVTFRAAPQQWGGEELDEVDVAYTGGSEPRDALRALGFDERAVNAQTLATTLTADVDVLLVGGTLNVASLTAENRAALDAFLGRGGGVVGLGAAARASATRRRC